MTPPSRLAALPPALLLGAELFVFGPHTVHAANVAEFSEGLAPLLPALLIGVLAVTLAGTLLGALLPAAARSRWTAALLVAALLAWAQGNLLLGHYGRLDGSPLEVTLGPGARLAELGMWLAALLAALIAHRPLARVAGFVSVLLLGLQAAVAALGLGQSAIGSAPTQDPAADAGPETPAATTPAVPADVFRLSRRSNLVLVILDTLTGDVALDILESDRPRWDAALPGLVVFEDALAPFATTVPSLAATLGAPRYLNDESLLYYGGTAYDRAPTLPAALLEAGWRVDWIALTPAFCDAAPASLCWPIPRPYAGLAKQRRLAAVELADLSLFRHAPHALKPAVYADGEWTLRRTLLGGGHHASRPESTANFLRDAADRLVADRDEPVLKVIHVSGGHEPLVLDGACAVTGDRLGPTDAAAYRDQVACNLDLVGRLMKRMDALGVLEASTLILIGDHGGDLGARGEQPHPLDTRALSRARTLLAVKWPGTSGPITRRRAPATLLDVAPTLAAAAGVDWEPTDRRLALSLGESAQGNPTTGATDGLLRESAPTDLAALPEDAGRVRAFAFHTEDARRHMIDGHLFRLERYLVDGPSERPASWRLHSVLHAPGLRPVGRRVDLGTPDGDLQLSFHGWGASGADSRGTTWATAEGPSVSFYLSLVRSPAGGDFTVTLEARRPAGAGAAPAALAVAFDDVRLPDLPLDGLTTETFAPLRIDVPGDRISGEVQRLTLAPLPAMPAGARTPWLQVDSLRWERR